MAGVCVVGCLQSRPELVCDGVISSLPTWPLQTGPAAGSLLLQDGTVRTLTSYQLHLQFKSDEGSSPMVKTMKSKVSSY